MHKRNLHFNCTEIVLLCAKSIFFSFPLRTKNIEYQVELRPSWRSEGLTRIMHIYQK